MSAWWCKLALRYSAIRVAIGAADPVLLLRVLLFASTIRLLMRLKLSRVARLLGQCGAPQGPPAAIVERIVRHVRLVRRIGSPFVRSDCLTQALTLCYFLRRAGIDVTLSFGIMKVAGQFVGHCWLTHEGLPILEPEDPRASYAHVISIPNGPLPGRTGPRRLSDLFSC